jgi:hypothetical protein
MNGMFIADFFERKGENPMHTESRTLRAGVGAAAGLVGTVLIQGLMTASQKWAPQSLPPIKQDPGEFMVEKAEQHLPSSVRDKIPEEIETAAAKFLALGYGITFGALYGSARPETKSLIMEGSALGLAAWAAGYLGWLPASELMPPVTEQEPEQIGGPILSHMVLGIATVGLYRCLQRL